MNEFVIKVFWTFFNILVSNYVMCDCVNGLALSTMYIASGHTAMNTPDLFRTPSTPQTEALVLNEFVIKVFRTFVNILVSNYVMCDCVNECAFEHTAHR